MLTNNIVKKFNVRTVSRRLLIFEIVLLAYPSVIGLLISAAGINSFIFGLNKHEPFINNIGCLMVFLAIVSGWRIIHSIVSEDIVNDRKINTVWWLFASLGIPINLYSLLMLLAYASGSGGFTILFVLLLGGIFILTFCHLIFETRRQKRESCLIKEA